MSGSFEGVVSSDERWQTGRCMVEGSREMEDGTSVRCHQPLPSHLESLESDTARLRAWFHAYGKTKAPSSLFASEKRMTHTS